MAARAVQNTETGAVEPVQTKRKRQLFADKKSAAIGAIAAATLLLCLFLVVFFTYTKSTNELNESQRFRAVCEYQGGMTVETFCIKGDRVLTIN